MAQTLIELAPGFGSAESLAQLVTGQSSLTGEEASRFWAAVGLVPTAGGMVPKVGEPAADALVATLREVKLADLGYESNKVSHIFSDKHMLQPLVAKFGSEAEALKAMHVAAQSLVVNPNTYQTGAWVTLQIQGVPVSVKGVVIDGVFRISTATMRPF